MSIKKFTPTNVREESVKLKVGQNFFQLYDVDVLGDIDFTVAVKEDGPSLFETDCCIGWKAVFSLRRKWSTKMFCLPRAWL